MTLENLIGRGLQKEPGSPEQIQQFLTSITTRLAYAQKDSISLESRFHLAYEGLLQIGLDALKRPNDQPTNRPIEFNTVRNYPYFQRTAEY